MSTRLCGCDPEAKYVSEGCFGLGYCRCDREGGAVPLSGPAIVEPADNIQCTHCGEHRLIELAARTGMYDNYLCAVCSKIFSVRRHESSMGSKPE